MVRGGVDPECASPCDWRKYGTVQGTVLCSTKYGTTFTSQESIKTMDDLAIQDETPVWLINAALQLQEQAPPLSRNAEVEPSWALPWSRVKGFNQDGEIKDMSSNSTGSISTSSKGAGESLQATASAFWSDKLRRNLEVQRRCEDGSEFALVYEDWRDAEKKAGRRRPFDGELVRGVRWGESACGAEGHACS